jgi:hypothetical protein
VLGEDRREHASDNVAMAEPQVFVIGRASTAGLGGLLPDGRPIAQNPLYIYFQNSICAGIVDELARSLGRRMG